MNGESIKKVLIVDDDVEQHDRWRNALGGKAVLLNAFSIEEAREKFEANSDIDAIVMDACVPGHSPNTLFLVREFKKTFTRPMIAVSSDPDYLTILVNAGCTHKSKKNELPHRIIEILSL